MCAQLGKFTKKSSSCILEVGESHMTCKIYLNKSLYLTKGRVGVSCVSTLLHYSDSSPPPRQARAFIRILQVGTASGRAQQFEHRSPDPDRALRPQEAVSESGPSLQGPWRYLVASNVNLKGFFVRPEYLLVLKTSKSRVKPSQVLEKGC